MIVGIWTNMEKLEGKIYDCLNEYIESKFGTLQEIKDWAINRSDTRTLEVLDLKGNTLEKVHRNCIEDLK